MITLQGGQTVLIFKKVNKNKFSMSKLVLLFSMHSTII